ncbi:MAG: UDP-N-acetylmuramate dehydrogenase [Deltaproteobacteria bacterium]|nr:UDP-N-acetylmuramate dehydrogenase [Deltaproteobacteria bacterium]
MSLIPSIQEALRKKLKGELLFNESLARYTTIKIGGLADALLFPADLDDLTQAIALCRALDLPYFVMGNGSNLLIRDGGVRGLVIRLQKTLNQFRALEEKDGKMFFEIDAGYSLPKFVEYSKQNGLSGIESLYGVPGTLGGAVMMNAGTREGEISSVIESVTVLDAQGHLKTYPKKRLAFEYRALKIPRAEIILKAQLGLLKSESSVVAEKIEFFQKRRHDTQPLDQANLGSVFKNPPKKYAAELIEELGLKGVRVGGARISTKHSNWIVNEGQAKARDVLALIGLVKDKVKEITGIKLETEVKIVGEDPKPIYDPRPVQQSFELVAGLS